MTKEQQQKIILIVLLGVGSIYVYATHFLLPELAKIQGLQQTIAQKQEYYRQLQIYQGDRTGLQTEISQLQNTLNQVAVPRSIDKPQLMLYLYKMAKSHAVNAQTVKFDTVQQKGFYQEMPLSLNCQGTPQDILRLLTDLKNGSEQRLVPRSVNLTWQQGVMRGEIKLVAYSLIGQEK